MDKNTEIRKIAAALNQDIQELKRQLDGKKVMLGALGNVCDHPTVKMYRDRQIETCEFCLHEFMSRSQVDAVFSD
jgi:hypothetical protein